MAKAMTEKQLFDARGGRRGSFHTTKFCQQHKDVLKNCLIQMDGLTSAELRNAGISLKIPNIHVFESMRTSIRALKDAGVI